MRQQEAADTHCMGQQVTGRVEPEEMMLVVADGIVLQALKGVVLQALEGVVLQDVVLWALVAHVQGQVLQLPQALEGGYPQKVAMKFE